MIEQKHLTFVQQTTFLFLLQTCSNVNCELTSNHGFHYRRRDFDQKSVPFNRLFMEQNHLARLTCSKQLLRKYPVPNLRFCSDSSCALRCFKHLSLRSRWMILFTDDWWMPVYLAIWRTEWWVFELGALSWLSTRSLMVSMFSAIRADRGVPLPFCRSTDHSYGFSSAAYPDFVSSNLCQEAHT